jgi:hypothetical protein
LIRQFVTEMVTAVNKNVTIFFVIAGLDPAIHAVFSSQHGPPGQARW